jgi:pimeloyl-ACP methyl ester carboxylesterase
MNAHSFDPTHAVRFDLPRGSVHTERDGARMLLVPAAALDDLVLSAPPEVLDLLGRSIGAAIGRRAAARIGDAQGATVEAFVTQIAGEAAVAGVGALSVERWGRALVVVVEGSSLAGPLLHAVVGSAVEAAAGRRVSCVLLSRDEQVARFFLGSEGGCARLKEWLLSGATWGEALVKLHGGAA